MDVITSRVEYRSSVFIKTVFEVQCYWSSVIGLLKFISLKALYILRCIDIKYLTEKQHNNKTVHENK